MKNKLFITSLTLFLIGCGGDGSSSSSTSIGSGGSMARFAFSGDFLYTINQREMNIFDVKDVTKPKKISKIHVPFDVETLFAYKENLYVGSQTGLYIYDNKEPTQPVRIASFSHVQSCDPVVVFEDIAYVTLSGGDNCFNKDRAVNRLEIVDVKDPYNPEIINAIDMFEPKGLAIDNHKLFLCDGEAGLKVFELEKRMENNNTSVELTFLETKEGIDCYDVIAEKNNLIVSNKEDIRQFNYSSFPMEEEGEIK